MKNEKENCQKKAVRPVAQSLFECLLFDVWPTPAGIVDFFIDSERHYGALQYAVRDLGVTPEQLDAALGDGVAITALITPDNPYHGVEFGTAPSGWPVPIDSWANVASHVEFSLGHLMATAAVLKAVPRDDIIHALRRHAAIDWAKLKEQVDDLANAEVNEEGEFISQHQSIGGQAFQIMTIEQENSTLVLLPGR